jgi:hypothetical protein
MHDFYAGSVGTLSPQKRLSTKTLEKVRAGVKRGLPASSHSSPCFTLNVQVVIRSNNMLITEEWIRDKSCLMTTNSEAS